MKEDLGQKSLIDTLSAYPHIQHKLETLWGTKDGRDFINGLIFNTSGRITSSVDGIPKNQGFPLSVIQTITDILVLHDTQFPEFGKKKQFRGTFVWD